MSILADQPLVAPKGLRLSLELDELKLVGLFGVIHNCRQAQTEGADGFRLGIQFRPNAADQFDRAEAERILKDMERVARKS